MHEIAIITWSPQHSCCWGFGWNLTCAVGDFAYHLGLFNVPIKGHTEWPLSIRQILWLFLEGNFTTLMFSTLWIQPSLKGDLLNLRWLTISIFHFIFHSLSFSFFPSFSTLSLIFLRNIFARYHQKPVKVWQHHAILECLSSLNVNCQCNLLKHFWSKLLFSL